MKTQRNRKDGSVLLTVMMLSAILAAAAASMVMFTGNAAFRARKLHNSAEALAIAEAGVGYVVAQMEAEGIPKWMSTNVTVNFADGSFTVQTTYDNVTGNIIIQSTGRRVDEQRTVAAEILGDLYLFYDEVLGIGGSIVADGDVIIETSAGRITGNVHANGNISSDNTPTTVDGHITAVGTVTGNFDGPASINGGSAPVVVPDFQPFTAWEELAKNGGLYYANSQVFGGVNLAPGNGVLFVDGDITIGQNSSLHGTIVATGSVDIGQRFQHTPFDPSWPAVLAGLNVDIGQNGNYDGVIFAGNNINIVNRQDSVKGSLIALNNVHLRNRVILEPLSAPAAWSPDGGAQEPPEVVIGGWLR